MPTQVPIEPHEHDVLMGRGGRNNQHSGNDILRQFGRLEGENYRVASKKGKSAISRLLVRQMRELDPPARYIIARSYMCNFVAFCFVLLINADSLL
jgi:hypothetical protein